MSYIPKVSVCIPTYNRSEYLREAIESVLIQSFSDFELIICDNASVDNTTEVVNSFCDSRIKYHRNPENLGSFNNINLCLKLAKGEYITIFHDDDVMLQDNILDKVSFLDAYPNAGLVDSNAYFIDGLGKTIGMYWKENTNKKPIAKGENCFRDLFLGHNTICFPAVFLRRECYENLGGFEEMPYCDWELWMRISLFYDIGYLPKPLIKYRRHANNDSLNHIHILEEYKAKSSVFTKYKSKFKAKNTNDFFWLFLFFLKTKFLHLIVYISFPSLVKYGFAGQPQDSKALDS